LLVLLFLQLGRSRLMDIGHQTIGLAASCTSHNQCPTEPLKVSISVPTEAEIAHNLKVSTSTGLFDDATTKVQLSHPIVGYSLQFNELKVEEPPRFCPVTTQFVGLCHEHSRAVSHEFNTISRCTL
jgi:hypothetical protein